MASDLKTHRLGDLLDTVIDHRGRTPKKLGGDFAASGVRVISAKNVKDGRLQDLDGCRFISESMFELWMPTRLQVGDVLLTSEAPLGEVAYLRDDANFCLGQRLFALRADRSKLDGRFLSYLLRSPQVRHRLRARATGTTAQGIRQAELVRVQVEIPPLPEQRRIASILGSLDDKIELNRRMNRTLESIARAIFKSWFVDFDPVRKKMEGKTGGELGLPPSLAALFPNRLIESKLGELPEGWAVGCLGDVALQVRDTVRPEDIPKDLAYFGLEHLPRRSIALAEWSDASDIASSKSRFAKGDILFGRLRPYFHKVGPPPVEGVCSTDIVVVRPKSRVLASFVLGHVSSDEFVDHVSAASSGTRMPRTTWKDLAAYPIVIPSEDLCRAFDEMGRRIIDRIHSNILESRTASGVRDSFLPRLINGELLGGCGTGG
jgi:type I restriction enzyme S subunit